ncbi:MAG: hypothetical protein ABWW69_07045 [Pyrodictiaceae archaeon]
MERRLWAIVLAIITGLDVAVVTLNSRTVAVDSSVSGVQVRYITHFLTPQRFRIVVRNVSGQVYPTTLSIYAWMPNGSIIELGKFLGEYGAVDIGVQRIASFLEEWHRYIISHGDDPRLVEPGIIVLGAIHTPMGIYGVMKGIPLDTERILKGLSVEINIVENLVPGKVLVPMSEVKKEARRIIESIKAGKTNTSMEEINIDSKVSGKGASLFSSEWPPSGIKELRHYMQRGWLH